MVEDGSFVYVEPSEGNGTEEDSPDAWGDLLETDELAAEQMRDVDPDGVPANSSIARDLSDLEVRGILGRAQL